MVKHRDEAAYRTNIWGQGCFIQSSSLNRLQREDQGVREPVAATEIALLGAKLSENNLLPSICQRGPGQCAC